MENLSNTSMEMDEESLADVRRDNTSKQDVLDLVSIILNDAMVRHLLNNNDDTIHSKRPLNERERDVSRAQQSPEERRSTQDANTAARKRTRAQQSLELDERRSTQDADTAARKRTRAQQSLDE
eukprot:scaffold16177_cov127-Skeletonema_dohrnii-CCMP3373.AAC.1